MSATIKLFGLPRTCTTVLSETLAANYLVGTQQNEIAWKHGNMAAFERERKDAPIVITVKHVLPWLASYWRVFQTYPAFGWLDTFEAFVKWRGQPMPKSHEIHCPVVHAWSLSTGYWLWKSQRRNVLMVRAEDFVEDAERTCESVAGHFGLERRPIGFSVPEKHVGPYSSGRSHTQIREYYRTQSWREHYTPELEQWVLDRTDAEVLERLEYALD